MYLYLSIGRIYLFDEFFYYGFVCVGDIHVADFNVSTFIPPEGQYLKKIAGTVPYMAPEMINEAGYRGEVDWWSLGVVMYELLFCRVP